MAGTISLSLSQQFDSQGVPLSGGLLYFFEAGTTTPQSAYQDQALTIAYPNPITLDASGRVPAFFLADGNIKIRLTDDSGVTIIAADNLMVIGPSSGEVTGGGGDATAVLQTGDIKARYGTGTLDGFARCNGRTIGNSLSGATEKADTDDCRALFEYLYINSTLTVTPPRAISATADFDAGAQLTLPDLRGRTIAGLDDMGTTAAGRLTSTYFGAAGTTLGNSGGSESIALLAPNLPPYTPAGTISGSVSYTPAGTVSITDDRSWVSRVLTSATDVGGFECPPGNNSGAVGNVSTTSSPNVVASGTISGSFTGTAATPSISGTFTGTAQGGVSTPFSRVMPALVLTFYIKL